MSNMAAMSRAPVLWTCLSVFGLVAAATATVACSAVSKVDYAACSDNVTCRDAFGLGWTCGEAGLCQEALQHPRCKAVFPETLFDDPETYGNAIIFGSQLDHTPVTGDGRMVDAATLAIKEANMSGLDGRLFGIVHCDYREDEKIDKLTSDEAVVETAKYLVDDLGAVAIIGPGYSSLAESLYLELQKDTHKTSTLIVSPSATSDSLTNVDVRDGDKPGLFWRTAPPDSRLGKALAQQMDADGITYATVVYVNDSYGSGLATNVGDNFPGEIDLRGFKGEAAAAADINTIVAELDSRTPAAGEAVVFVGAEVAQVVAFLNGAVVYDYFTQDDSVKIYLSDAGFNDAVLEQTQELASELYDQVQIAFPSVNTEDLVYKKFKSAYQTEFNDNPDLASYSSHMYDATWLGVYGTVWAYYRREQRLSGIDLAFGLQQVTADKTAIPVRSDTFNDIKTEFQAGRAVNLQGASGNLDYNPETEELKDVTPIFYVIVDGSDGYEFMDPTPPME